MNCPKCGYKNDNNASRCSCCGEDLLKVGYKSNKRSPAFEVYLYVSFIIAFAFAMTFCFAFLINKTTTNGIDFSVGYTFYYFIDTWKNIDDAVESSKGVVTFFTTFDFVIVLSYLIASVSLGVYGFMTAFRACKNQDETKLPRCAKMLFAILIMNIVVPVLLLQNEVIFGSIDITSTNATISALELYTFGWGPSTIIILCMVFLLSYFIYDLAITYDHGNKFPFVRKLLIIIALFFICLELGSFANTYLNYVIILENSGITTYTFTGYSLFQSLIFESSQSDLNQTIYGFEVSLTVFYFISLAVSCYLSALLLKGYYKTKLTLTHLAVAGSLVISASVLLGIDIGLCLYSNQLIATAENDFYYIGHFIISYLSSSFIVLGLVVASFVLRNKETKIIKENI